MLILFTEDELCCIMEGIYQSAYQLELVKCNMSGGVVYLMSALLRWLEDV
jgi:hypothetical protein